MKEFKLGKETTRAILRDALNHLEGGGDCKELDGGTEGGEDETVGELDSRVDGFVQVLITRPGEEALLGVDFRASKIDFDELPPLKLLAVTELTTVLGEGSCAAASTGGGYASGWELPAWVCKRR